MRLTLLAVALLAACVIVQSGGMVVLIQWLARLGHVLESTSTSRRVGLLLRLFLSIVLLHLVQVGLWAAVFWGAGQVPTLETAVYFSLVTYTTIGFGDVVLGPGWRVLTGIEGLTGILLVGWSTAFVFAVVNRMYEHWRDRHEGREALDRRRSIGRDAGSISLRSDGRRGKRAERDRGGSRFWVTSPRPRP
jgi:hypothetical protein